jgi:hypothetical protein
MVRVADLAAIGIGAAPDAAIVIDAAADAGGKRHVEQRRVAASGAEAGLAQRAGVGVVIHDGGHAEQVAHPFGEPEVAPSADVRGERHALLLEDHGTAEADAAAVRGRFALPGARDGRDLVEHPVAAAFGIGAAGFAAHHAVAIERRDGELGAADVNRQRSFLGHRMLPEPPRARPCRFLSS